MLFTASGKKYADGIMKPLMEREEKAITVLSNEERNEMINMLERCYNEYQKLI